LNTPRWAFDWLALLALATLLVGLGYRVWRDRPMRIVNRWFAFQAVVLAGWVVGVAALHSGVMLDVWGAWTFASAGLFPLAFLGFTRVFPEESPPVRAWLWVTVSAASVGLSALCLFTPWIAHSFVLTSDGLRRLPGPLYPIYAAFLPLATAVLIAIQISRWRHARGRARLQLQYYIVGVSILAIGGFTTNLAIPTFTGRSAYSVFGPYFALAFLALVGHSIIRHRLLDLRIVVSHSLTFATAVVVSLLPAGALLGIFWPQLNGRLTRDEVTVGAIAVLTVALLTPPLRDAAGRLLDRYVHRHRANVRRILRAASTALSNVLDPDRVTQTMLDAVCEMLSVEGAAFYLWTPEGVRLIGSKIVHVSRFATPPEMAPHVCRAAASAPSVMIVGDDLERAATHAAAPLDLDAALRATDWALVVPVVAQGALVGILAIGRKLSGDPFSAEDLDAISTLSNHAGSAVKNAQLYAESALAKDYISSIVSTMPSGVVAVSAEGRIVLFNAAAEQLTGSPEAHVSGAPIEVLPPALCEALRSALAHPARQTYPQIPISATDATRMAICTTAPLRSHAGSLAGAVAVFSDLSPVRELELERSRAERLAGFQVLTQALAHEIANPLSPIKTMTRLLEHRGHDGAFVQEFQRIVTRELERMERLITRLRTVGRPQRQIVGRVDLCKAIVASIELLAASADERAISLRLDARSPEVTVTGDEAEFQEVFLNLIKNAIEAIPESASSGSVAVDVSASDAEAVVRVKDSGSGFSAALIDQVFVPFVSTKPRGSGLGLVICASVIQRAGGRIDVANAPDGGGVVTIRVPLREKRGRGSTDP
jgi:signal transduction histidine kinase